MKSKISKTRRVKLSGLVNGVVQSLPVVCVRKNVVRFKAGKAMVRLLRKHQVLGFISHPTIYKSETAKFVDAWCHCYRNPDAFIPGKPRLLLSESDFVDPLYLKTFPRARHYKWDFFYFTGGGKQSSRKGLNIFIEMLPWLFKAKLRGIVINYTRQSLSLNRAQKRIWNNHSKCFVYYHKTLDAEGVARLMSISRFGLFPNTIDCSPLLLAESLVRDCPVLVNPDILGGWKYVCKTTGCFYNINDPLSSFELMMGDFLPRETFLNTYGFDNSAFMLAQFGRDHLSGFDNCMAACFSGLARFLVSAAQRRAGRLE